LGGTPKKVYISDLRARAVLVFCYDFWAIITTEGLKGKTWVSWVLDDDDDEQYIYFICVGVSFFYQQKKKLIGEQFV